ncbi:hypothetical protein LAZ67_3006256 [Cordylochernes scorpioides]|uniref:Reverse transcriptase n=1 Tax=Cordylochernes scorpioides TaxID=51811 RepID=A0ABY6KAZ9_9ARAC|nr:hypothetical protein LAZ67_3006256 [Cordylochernes scorpioides]
MQPHRKLFKRKRAEHLAQRIEHEKVLRKVGRICRFQIKSKCANDIRRKVWTDLKDFVRRFVTMDETWVHHYTTETKQQSKAVGGAGGSAPKKAKSIVSAGKVSVFWDVKGILLNYYLEKDRTITDYYYSNLLDQLDFKIHEKMLGLRKKKTHFSLGKRNCSQRRFVNAKTTRSKEFVNVLGLQWQPRTDGFTFKGIALPLNSMTKRGILSQTGLEWDDPIPEELRRKLTLINQDLPSLEHIQIPRCVVPGNFMKVEFHGFFDASQKAYAASLYLKVILSNTSAKTFLLVAKTRVAPMKVVSLPKLELCSALLLARYENLPLTINEIYLWSDSTIALCWINSEPCRWKTFVANRVAEIHRLVSGVWCHVDGRQNPADCASRGIFPSDLVEHPLWWNGPPWLIEPALEIKKFINSSKEEFKEEEKIKTYFGTIECEIPSIVINCPSLNKLICIIAWCLRFVNNSRMPSHSRNREPLTLRELNDALLTVVKCVQSIEFSKEKHCLLSNKPIPNKSRIYNLCPFMDSRGIIRVGGRLKNVNVYGDRINQVLLPRSHHLTTLIVNNVHVHNLHSSTQATLAAIGNIFWMPSGRNVVRKISRKCMKCARFRKKRSSFSINGKSTFCKDQQIKAVFGTTSTMNAYVALFICFSTRAIHLELISSLTTDALISTIRRFIARRGKPATIHSDNATNFVGVHKIIGKLCHNASKVLTNSEGIQWKFIPPSAPHFGGLWEAGVKSMKYHLRRTMGSALLNFKELTTLLAHIEACLNSRPLCPLSEDPEDLQALTPGHFLIGGSLTAPPDEDDIIAMSLPNRWQLIQKSMNHFWTKWSQEYVSQLQQRSKWCKPQPNIKEGSLVLIKNEQQPPLAWKIGRISKVFPGDDARIRVVEVKTANGTYRRPIKGEELLNNLFPDDKCEEDTNIHKSIRNYNLKLLNKENPMVMITEVNDLIDKLNPKKSPGIDKISNNMLRHTKQFIAPILVKIFQKFLDIQYYPAEWKRAEAIIIPKPGKTDFNNYKNYRPLCLNSNISKIFEKIINNRIIKYYEDFNLLSDRQHGFRRSKSTITALTEIIKIALEHKTREYAAIIAVDISAAFDNAWWPALMKRLDEDGVQASMIKLLQLYFDNRRIRFRYSSTEINKKLSKGCPQGGPLSPTLWNILINEILNNNLDDNCETIGYADDITLICWNKTPEQLRKTIDNVLRKINKWCESRKLKLSDEKTKILYLYKCNSDIIVLRGEMTPAYISYCVKCSNPLGQCHRHGYQRASCPGKEHVEALPPRQCLRRDLMQLHQL